MRRLIPVCFMALCLVLGSFAVQPALAQGVAVPKRAARPEPPLSTSTRIPRIQFQDIAAKAGLTARHVTGGDFDKQYILETTGSGVAFIDYDNDGWPDIFTVNGTTLAGFPQGKEPSNHLYHNNRDGTFTDVTKQANLERTGWGQGVCVGDFDNDGYDDIFVTYYGQNVLYKNDGKGKFIDVTEKAGLIQKKPGWSTGCSFLDYDRDGKLDLFVANYVDLDLKKTPAKGSSRFCIWKGIPVMCGPRGLPSGTNLLYHNNGNGTFTDVSDASGISKVKGRYGFTALVSDFDNDGWPDIYVACDSTPSILYHNERNGTFTDMGFSSGTALNEDGQEQAGMGAAAADYDQDGFIDIVKTNFEDDTPTLYHNSGDGSFSDVTYQSRIGSHTRYLGWGVCFMDFDNDGWKDILMVNGHVYPEVEGKEPDGHYKQERLLYRNLGDGTFMDVSPEAGPGILDKRCSRGAAAGDIDNDGGLEIVVNNMNDTPSLLKNFGERGNWVLVKTVGKQSNRDGIGARVTVVTGGHKQIDEVRSGGSYMSQNDLRLHFGLGKAEKIDRIEVSWPSGVREAFINPGINRVLVLQEGTGTALAGKAEPAKK